MAKLDSESCYKAMLSRDRRFDGRFFIGVVTTGIYCRPICPAKPKKENVRFFATRLAAEKEGFRPCLRCRPEAAPGSPAWYGTNATVDRALRLIFAHDFTFSEDEIAKRLGVSSRHLRRLFQEQFERSPKQIADARRLDFARQLVVETSMPITDIATAAGFKSLRRFNDAMKQRFTKPPRELRRKKSDADPDRNSIRISLSYRPPLDWQHLLDFHRVHALPGLQEVAQDSFVRRFREKNGKFGSVKVTNDETKNALIADIEVSDPRELSKVVRRIRHIFDLDSDPVVVDNAFKVCPLMARLSKKRPALRLPRGWDPFETSIATILGQLVSTQAAARLVAQLIENYGIEVKGSTFKSFPTPEMLESSRLDKLGTTQARKETIREFSKRVASGEISFDETQSLEDFAETLSKIRGIGPWTVDYIRLRALGDTDAFPGTDLILKRAVEKYPNTKIEELKPWRGYAAIYLWDGFAQKSSRGRDVAL